MVASFMSECAGGNASTPLAKHCFVGYSHVGRNLRIKIHCRGLRCGQELMAQVAVAGRWRDSQIRIMTTEADCVTSRRCLERALLQPKIVVDVFRRLGDIFFA